MSKLKLHTTFLLTGILICLVSSSAFAGAKMTIENPSFNFGYVPQMCVVSCKIKIKSTGTDTLKIKDIIPGCSCTKAPLLKDMVAPGDSTEIEIIFSTKRFLNKVTKKPKLVSNSTPSEDIIEILAHVIKRTELSYPITITPAILTIYQFTNKVQDKIQFEIKNVSNENLKIDIIYSSDDYFEIKLPKEIKKGKTVAAEIIIALEKLDISFEKSFTIELNDKKKTRFTIPVVREVKEKK